MLRQFLGIRTDTETASAAVFIRSRQRADGTWANFFGGPGDLSTTVEAYVALRLGGDAPDAPHMALAAEFIRGSGGLEATRVFTHIWLALFGLWPWEEIPAIPPEVMFLPPSVPLNVYEFGCWARQTFVALSIVASYHPVRPLPFGLEELRSGKNPEPGRRTLATWRGRFLIIDELAHRYDKIARRGLIHRHVRERALTRAEQWIVRRQESDGSWGGIQPPWVYSIIALHLRGYPIDHPVVSRAFEGLDGFLVHDGPARWLEACQSPIWDTALAVIALADAGAAPDDPALRRSSRWLVDQEAARSAPRGTGRSDVPSSLRGRVVVRVRERKLPRRRRHRRGHLGVAQDRDSRTRAGRGNNGDRAASSPGPRGWSPRRRSVRAPSTPTTSGSCSTSCRSRDFGAVIDPPSVGR